VFPNLTRDIVFSAWLRIEQASHVGNSVHVNSYRFFLFFKNQWEKCWLRSVIELILKMKLALPFSFDLFKIPIVEDRANANGTAADFTIVECQIIKQIREL
jgi:hypothetical protein